MRTLAIALVIPVIPAIAGAQTPALSIPSAAEQIEQAVAPLPAAMRADASVFGYAPDGKFVTLRDGSGSMTCLASNPRMDRWHVACYHKSLEPFMARGRELRTQGVQGPQVDSVRFREVKAGTLRMPTEPAMLYSLTGAKDAWDATTKSAPKASLLFVAYVPNATVESTGLSAQPQRGMPWVMFPGTPKAHIMFTPTMSP
jgi:hypothetical protein